jgi:hypothetical protein
MGVIESGRVVAVEIVVKVPADMPPGPQALEWLKANIQTTLHIQQHVANVSYKEGTLQPSKPALVVP